MIEIAKNLITETYETFKSNLDFFWPSKNGYPHENNIGTVLSNIAVMYGFRVYSECSISGGRRDLVLINEEKKWACQVELKHMFVKGFEVNVLDDLWRVYLLTPFHNYLNECGLKDVDKYKKYGLFLSFGSCNTYKWWKYGVELTEETKQDAIDYLASCGIPSAKIDEQIKTLGNWMNYDANKLIKGLFQADNNMKNPFWFCYSFIECDDKDN